MRKPQSCLGCPFYSLSPNMVPDEIREQSRVFIMGQNPGKDEEAIGLPFVGKTGVTMEARYLKEAGLTREEVSLGNAIRCRLGGKDDLPQINSKDLKVALHHCSEAHLRIPEGTKLIVAQGDYASLLLTGEKVEGWRGYLRPLILHGPVHVEEPWVPGPREAIPVLVTSHLARLFKEPSLMWPTFLDWGKIPRILAGRWPRKPPQFATARPHPWPNLFTFDTEYENDWLQRWSMAWGVEDGQTYVEDRADVKWWNRWDDSSRGATLVSQYTPADVRWLEKFLTPQTDPWTHFTLEDTVWKHAVLWSEHPHDLNYLASIYSSFNRWKHLGSENPTLYSGLDATGLFEVNQALNRELDNDPRSRRVWEHIDRPALGGFVRAQYGGLQINPSRLQQAISTLEDEASQAQIEAQALLGWPINLGSAQQVSHQLYTVEGVKPPPKRR